ncbi:PREDICTED: RING-H2 finger protein ATL63-like [Camelina sativa]|uniref:RING-type E3 ubiquitin transferase n=1 Tax=Camelina sativa TaxID=90675 RepID=A0ABM0UN47_CAMSA|nr:PREDICTED: RING-H2 finger protein ATL63-like [Camelina sativa]
MIMREEEEDGSMSVKSSLSNFLKILSSYNSNVLLAALVFLLLVVLFVLLLHFYARFFWSPSHQDLSSAARRRRRRRRSNRRRTVTTTRIIPSLPLDGGGVNTPAVVAAAVTTNDDKGLDLSVISSIPLFVYEDDEDQDEEDECVICLGLWEVGEFGRKLRNCGHGFHVECIDMWLSSHSTCPLCRSPVLAASVEDNLKPSVDAVVQEETEVRLQLSQSGEDDRRFSLSLAEIEDDDHKTGVDDGYGDRNGVGEGEVRIEVYDDEEEMDGGGSSRGDRRSMSMTSSASSSLMRMLSCSSTSSRSERNKVFPSATQDSSK